MVTARLQALERRKLRQNEGELIEAMPREVDMQQYRAQ